MSKNFVKPLLKRATGSKTTDVNTYEQIEDDATGFEYFRLKGYTFHTIAIVVTLNDLDMTIQVAHEDDTGVPDEWIDTTTVDETYAATANYRETLGEDWDFIRFRIKPTVAAAHGKMAVTIRSSTL